MSMNRKFENGFSLLEAVISLAIAGFILTAFFETTSTNLNLTNRSAAKAKSTILIQSVISQIGKQFPLATNTNYGKSSNGYSWQVDIKPHSLQDFGMDAYEIQPLYHIHVKVFLNDNVKPIDELETFRVGTN